MQLLEQYDSVELLAAAMKLLTGDKKDVNIELTPEDPIRSKKRKFEGNRGGGYGSSSGRRYGSGGGSGQGSWRQGQGRSDSRGGSGYGGGQRKPYNGGNRSSSNRDDSSYRDSNRGGRPERREEYRGSRSQSEDFVKI